MSAWHRTQVLLFIYVGTVHVSLMNLLIAMFTDTYRRVNSNAEKEYAFKTFVSTHKYLHVHTALPPPFNAPWIVWDFFQRLCCRKRLMRPNPSLS